MVLGLPSCWNPCLLGMPHHFWVLDHFLAPQGIQAYLVCFPMVLVPFSGEWYLQTKIWCQGGWLSTLVCPGRRCFLGDVTLKWAVPGWSFSLIPGVPIATGPSLPLSLSAEKILRVGNKYMYVYSCTHTRTSLVISTSGLYLPENSWVHADASSSSVVPQGSSWPPLSLFVTLFSRPKVLHVLAWSWYILKYY